MSWTKATKGKAAPTPVSTPVLQRSAKGPEVDQAPPIVHEVLREPGQPLDTATREFFEPRFGADFSDVRVHSSAKATEATDSVDARAFTVGDDLVFAEHEHQPKTTNGRALLAHELAHTLQSDSTWCYPADQIKLSSVNGQQEIEAERLTDAAISAGDTDRSRNNTFSRGPSATTRMPASMLLRKTKKGQVEKQVSAEAKRVQQLNDDFADAVIYQQWEEAALLLNGFNDNDIKEKLSHLNPAQLRKLKQAALEVMPGWSERVVSEVENRLVAVGEGISSLKDAPQSDQPGGHGPVLKNDDIGSLGNIEKLTRATGYAKDFLRDDLRAEIDALFTPQAIGMMLAFAALFIAAQVTPAGWVADALGLATITIGAVFLGKQLFDIFAHLGGYLAAMKATSEQELRQAGHNLSEAIVKGGVGLILVLLTKAVKGTIKGGRPYEPPPTGMADAVTDTGLVIRVPIREVPATVPKSVPVAPASEMVEIGPGASTSPKGGRGRIPEIMESVEDPVINEAEISEQPGMRVRKPTELREAETAEGRQFDVLQGENYPANQVPIRDLAGKLRRLDSYDPVKREIISRKSLAASDGQLAFADVNTVIGHFQEFALKYRRGAKIADVPSARKMGLADKVLEGDYVLEVPQQRWPVPSIILEEAAKRGVIIRDVNGKVY